jgi:hypothetical protein
LENVTYLATALTSIVLLLEESQKWSEGMQNLDQTVQPPTVATMIMEMVQKGREHEQTRTVSEPSKQRKSSYYDGTSKKIVPQYEMKFSQEKRSTFSCPDATCWHFMLMPLNYIAKVKAINAKQEEDHQTVITNWHRDGRKGTKPSKKKPLSLELGGCFCCMQNCLNRPLGIGCMECKEAGGPTTIVDGTFFVDTICGCTICLCCCSIVFPLEE